MWVSFERAASFIDGSANKGKSSARSIFHRLLILAPTLLRLARDVHPHDSSMGEALSELLSYCYKASDEPTA